MGHACQILKFDTDDKKKIQRECDEWGNYNCDPYERGGRYGGLGYSIRFTSKVFDTYEQAEEYLDSTFGNYSQTAVQYYEYPSHNKTSAEQRIEDKLKKAEKALHELEDTPHYKGVKSQYITCPSCGSKIATKLCGETWYNTCPVCRMDIRPQSVIDRKNTLKKTISEANKELRAEKQKNDQKLKKKAKLCWAVACEVHC